MAESLPIVTNATYNIEVATIVRYLDRAIIEVVQSQSAPLSDSHAHDLTRLDSYLVNLHSFLTWAARQPESDTPKSHPIALTLPEAKVVPDIENDALWRVAQMLDTFRFEAVNSETSRRSNGVKAQDLSRWRSYLADVKAFIDDHIRIVQPIDYTESSPRALVQGQGALGV